MASLTIDEESKIVCRKCNVSFTAKSSLYRHTRKYHPYETVNVNGKYICPICQIKCSSMKTFQNHIETTHLDIKLNYENKTFYSIEEFNEWKKEIETNTLSQFVKQNATKELAGGRRASYLVCHRSGQFLPKKDRSRRSKRGGSIKIGSACPANIVVYEQTVNEVTEIQVTYQSQHIGHNMEVEKLRLSTSEKTDLAKQIMQGVPKPVILDKLRNQFSPTKRISLTSRKDLENIIRDFHIPYAREIKEKKKNCVKNKIKKSVLLGESRRHHTGRKMEVKNLSLSTSKEADLASQIIQGIPKPVILNKLQERFSPTKRISRTSRKDLKNITRDFHRHNAGELMESEEINARNEDEKSALYGELEEEKSTLLDEMKSFFNEIKTKDQLEIMRQSFYDGKAKCAAVSSQQKVIIYPFSNALDYIILSQS